MPPTNELWLRLTYWIMSNPAYSAEALVKLVRNRYPQMTANQAWTAVALFRNERHSMGG